MRNVDLLIHAKWVIPVNSHSPYYQDYSLVVHEGKIVDCLSSLHARTQYQSHHVYELKHHAVMPGLINAHGHSAMTLFRGLADDLPLMTWLNNHIWPAEAKWVNEDFVATGTLLAITEMLKTGTTCFSDMYFYPDITAKVAADHKIRAQIHFPVLDFPSVWAQNANEYISKGIKIHDQYRQHNLISTGFGPHAPYTVSDQPLEKIRTISEQLEIPVQIHLHETAFEVAESVKQTGERPLVRLSRLGLLSPSLQCVHMTQIDDSDINLLSESGANIIHCPESNLKLASGFCPVDLFLNAKINVALGTDGAASNNNLDMFGEMKTAALIAKAVANNAAALNAQQAIQMATINGARALGIEEQTGSLEVGKWADIIAIKMDCPELQPVYDPLSHIVYSGNAQQVSHSWIAGKIHMSDRVLTQIDQELLADKVRNWAIKINRNSE